MAKSVRLTQEMLEVPLTIALAEAQSVEALFEHFELEYGPLPEEVVRLKNNFQQLGHILWQSQVLRDHLVGEPVARQALHVQTLYGNIALIVGIKAELYALLSSTVDVAVLTVERAVEKDS